MNKLLCFVIMPFGTKEDTEGNLIDFDTVYRDFIQPAIEAAAMEPIRVDEETITAKPTRERLIFFDYVIADLTMANYSVLYQLGIRHALKPATTITVFSSISPPPVDATMLPGMAYEYDSDKQLTNLNRNTATLTNQLLHAKDQSVPDNSLFQLVDGTTFQNIVAHEKTDVFRDQVTYNETLKTRLAQAREKIGKEGDRVQAVDAIVSGLAIENEETGVLIDSMLSYRAVGAFQEMITFIESMPLPIQQTIMVQEQLGLALNRIGKSKEALEVLENVVAEHGPSSETYAIIGRVYKDLFEQARRDGDEGLAAGYLDDTLEAYRKGYEADWRDAFPGVNALTMLELKGQRQELRALAPVVKYAVTRKITAREADYWDYTVLLEIAIFENDEAEAQRYLSEALACPIEGSWMPDTTIKTLQQIKDYRIKRAEEISILNDLLKQLEVQKARFNG